MDKPEAYARALIEFSENIQKAEDKYAQQVGAISLEWNELHFLFYVCFQSLLKINDAEAKSLWESGSSDRQQRNMLRAIIGLMKRKANQKILIDGLNMADALGEYRNSLMHTFIKIDYKTLQPNVIDRATKIGHANRVREITKENKLSDLKKDLQNLSNFIFIVLPQLLGGARITSRKIPQSIVLPVQKKAKRKKTRPGKKARHHSQQKSSRL